MSSLQSYKSLHAQVASTVHKKSQHKEVARASLTVRDLPLRCVRLTLPLKFLNIRGSALAY